MLPYSGVDGARMSTNEAYLEPARGRPNLVVVADALVDRVLLDGTRAVGVRAVIDATPTDVRGDEVVISCGAIHSPAVLQRSGVGPAALLRSLRLAAVADVPVGDGLQDHIAVAIACQLDDGYVGPANKRPFSTCVRFTTGVPGSRAHDVMVQVLSPPSRDPFPFGIWGATLEQPLSSGTVRITTPDASRNPAIYLRFLTEAADRDRMRAAAARVLELLHEPALTKVCRGEAVPYRVAMDGMPDVSGSFDDLSGDAAVDRWIAETAATSLHASSTCAMGTVVDGSCRVFGIDGLRVADLSIAPVVPRANPNLTAIMIGEHLASMMQAGG
jgi:choline dehydrogenase